jgi:menaquinone-specific isochorismate synthase
MSAKITNQSSNFESIDLKVKILKIIDKKVFNLRWKGRAEIYRLQFPLENLDPLFWLQAQSVYPKIYWCDRKQKLEVAGLGQADVIQSEAGTRPVKLFNVIRSSLLRAGKSIRYFGGMAFDLHEQDDACWQFFGKFHFILPRFEIIRKGERASLGLNFRFSNPDDFEYQRQSLPAELERIVFTGTPGYKKIPALLSCRYNPGQVQWKSMVRKALDEIEEGQFEKIVLAHQSKFEFSAPLNAFTLLHRLKKLDPFNVYFYLQPKAEIGFICGTPELLYARQGRKISSEAVAATRLRGKNEQEDKHMEGELLTSPKDIKEHWFVLKSLTDSLKPLCHKLTQQGKTTILKQARIQHLYAQLKGELKQQVRDETIIMNLHPTPAVGGFPTRPALARLKLLEPFNRGWYAAPVGWISNQAAKFVVAIRSGLVYKNQLILFSGAGIVKGSQAESEWKETNNKIASYLKALDIRDDNE